MEVKRFSINKPEVRSGRQEGRPFIRVNRDKGDCWISISDGEIGLTAYLSDTELEQLIRDGCWQLRG